MARSASPRSMDVRNIFRLVGECAELGDDPVLWRTHFGAGLGRSAAAGWTLVAEMAIRAGRPRQDLGTTVWGWENGFDLQGWLEMLTAFRGDPLYNPLINAYVARLQTDPDAGLTRAD